MMADLAGQKAERIALVVVPSRPNEKIPDTPFPRFGWTARMAGSLQRPVWSNWTRASVSKLENEWRNEPKKAAFGLPIFRAGGVVGFLSFFGKKNAKKCLTNQFY
jgi:hypothetical protein